MKAKTEWKVGLFLAISLVVTAALVINFSKGTSPLTKTYTAPSHHQERRRPRAKLPWS